jgi:serine/threonine protein kinase
MVVVKEIISDCLDGKDLEFYEREVHIRILCKDIFLLDFIGFTMTSPYSIVTSFMPCRSIWDVIQNKTLQLNSIQKTNIVMGITYGMMYLHKHKVMHRGLNSPNILLDERCFPKIVDFGLNHFITDYNAFHKLTNNIEKK